MNNSWHFPASLESPDRGYWNNWAFEDEKMKSDERQEYLKEMTKIANELFSPDIHPTPQRGA
jgi:hypothetical protein